MSRIVIAIEDVADTDNEVKISITGSEDIKPLSPTSAEVLAASIISYLKTQGTLEPKPKDAP